jgi:hypothetical protein
MWTTFSSIEQSGTDYDMNWEDSQQKIISTQQELQNSRIWQKQQESKEIVANICWQDQQRQEEQSFSQLQQIMILSMMHKLMSSFDEPDEKLSKSHSKKVKHIEKRLNTLKQTISEKFERFERLFLETNKF